MSRTLVERLESTRRAIEAHTARGRGLGTRGRINNRGCELCDRYDALKAQLTQVGGHQNPEWRAYCDAMGAAYSHGGHDLFC